MQYYKKMEGKYVSLASICLDDADAYLQMKNSDGEMNQIVFQQYNHGKKYDLEMARNELNDLAVQNAFAVVDHDTNRMIGLVGLSNTLAFNQRSNLWVQMYTDIDYEEQVVKGAEAVDLLLQYCYQYLNLYNVVMVVPSFHMQALDICMQSLMQYYGIRTSSQRYCDGKFYDEIYFQCTPVLYEQNLGSRNREFYFNGNGVDLNIPYDNEEQMHKMIEGDRIILAKYDGQEEWISSLAHSLNHSRLSTPIGEFKTNWNDYRALKKLQSVDYVIVKDYHFLGYVDLFRKNYDNRSADLEILIANPEEHGKGYGKETLQLFLKEQYENGPFYNLLSTVFDFNDASIHLHKSLDYRLIGTRLQSYFAYGKLCDMHQFEMTGDIHEKQKRKEYHL